MSDLNITSSTQQSLGKQDFLLMLITQLKNQDPLKPVDNQEFLAQMAQFSALEQAQNNNTELTTLTTAFQRGRAEALIGHTVSFTDAQGATQTGIVRSVGSQADGSPVVQTSAGSVLPASILTTY